MSDDSLATSHYNEIGQQLLHLIEQDEIEVPMLPEVASKVVQLVQRPDSNAAALSALIQGDQVLAAKVMQIANSALYRTGPGVDNMMSLQQAITRLGLTLIGEVALAASINSSMFDAPGYEQHIKKTLRRSLATGLWAKEIARITRKNVEAAFLSGLLHDMGRPVVVQSVVAIAKSMGVTPSRDEVSALENEYQRRIGLKVVKDWEMPTSVCEVVQYFDNYQDQAGDQTQIMIVVAGDLLATVVGLARDETGELDMEEIAGQLLSEDVFTELNFYPDDIDALVQKAEQVTSTAESMSR